MSQKKVHEAFFLIDANEYQTISELRDKCSQLEKQLSDALKYKDLERSAHESHLHTKIGTLQQELNKHKSQKVTNEIFEPNAQEQIGSGSADDSSSKSTANTSQSTLAYELTQEPNQGNELSQLNQLQATNDDEFRKKLVAAFEQFLSSKTSHQRSSFVDQQSGSGVTEDLTPTLPITDIDSSSLNLSGQINPSTSNQSVPGVEEDNVGSFDEKLISSVPSTSRQKASKLLNELKNHQTDILFDPSGSITINGKTLPNGNIYEIFPLLYRRQEKKRPKDSPLSLVVNELASLGLSHLIQRSFSAGLLPRGQKYLQDRDSARKNIKGNWYYLGQDD